MNERQSENPRCAAHTLSVAGHVFSVSRSTPAIATRARWIMAFLVLWSNSRALSSLRNASKSLLSFKSKIAMTRRRAAAAQARSGTSALPGRDQADQRQVIRPKGPSAVPAQCARRPLALYQCLRHGLLAPSQAPICQHGGAVSSRVGAPYKAHLPIGRAYPRPRQGPCLSQPTSAYTFANYGCANLRHTRPPVSKYVLRRSVAKNVALRTSIAGKVALCQPLPLDKRICRLHGIEKTAGQKRQVLRGHGHKRRTSPC